MKFKNYLLVVMMIISSNTLLCQEEINKADYLRMAEKMPTVIGGLESIQERLNYPEEAKEQGISGRVFVLTFINEEGSVDKVELLKGDSIFASEALKVVSETKFTPAYLKGQPVKSQVTVPILFGTELNCEKENSTQSELD